MFLYSTVLTHVGEVSVHGGALYSFTTWHDQDMTLTKSRKCPATSGKASPGGATIEHTSLPPCRPRVAHKVISGPSAPLPTPEIVCETISSVIIALDDAIAGDVLECDRVATESHKQ